MTLGATSLDRVLAMDGVNELPGLSIESENQALLDCTGALQAMHSLAMMYRTPEQRAQLVPKCLAMSDNLAERSPSNAYAWYVGALASAQIEDWNGFNQRLAMSWRAGRIEQWIGELRVALAEGNYSRLDDITTANNALDLHMLVLSTRGVHAIAQRYVSDPGFRERITAIVETLPVEDQNRFVADVRRFANTWARSRS
ncbi:MAG: hypothetical protein ACOH2N_15525 [Devosia sp.]